MYILWIEILGEEVPIEVDGDYTAGTAGNITALPEDCYPEEGAEFSVTSVLLSGIEILSALSPDMIEPLETEILEKISQEDDGDYLYDQQRDRLTELRFGGEA